MGSRAACCVLAVVLLLLARTALPSSNHEVHTTQRNGGSRRGLDHDEIQWLRRQARIKYKLKVTRRSKDDANLALEQATFSFEAYRGLVLPLSLHAPSIPRYTPPCCCAPHDPAHILKKSVPC